MQHIKKHIFFIGVFILVCITPFLFLYRSEKVNNVKLINDSNIYLNIDSNKVEYYRIKKGEVLYCDVFSEDKNSYLCSWYFSKSEEPMIGWISSEDIIFKNGENINE